MGAPFVWFDLTVADGAKIAGFYQGLFGWETGPGAGGYQDWLVDGGSHGREPSRPGRCRRGTGFPTLRWTTSLSL
jgi:predicted enzyme related to lactoylglutathione lyase